MRHKASAVCFVLRFTATVCFLYLLQVSFDDAAEEPREFKDPPPITDIDRDAEHWMCLLGVWWIMIGIDGACADQAHDLLARAGYGVFVGVGHSQIFSERLFGPIQNAQRAETAALLHVVRIAWTHTFLIIDNKPVVDLFQRILDGETLVDVANKDL